MPVSADAFLDEPLTAKPPISAGDFLDQGDETFSPQERAATEDLFKPQVPTPTAPPFFPGRENPDLGLYTPRVDPKFEKPQAAPEYTPGSIGSVTGPLSKPFFKVSEALPFGEEAKIIASNLKGTKLEPAAKIGAGIVSGAEKVVGGAGDFMTSPLGFATLGLGAAPGAVKALASAAFATDMATHAPDSWQAYWEATYAEDKIGQAEALVEGLGTLAGAGLAGSHAYGEARTIIKEKAIPNATATRTAEAVLDAGATAPGVQGNGQDRANIAPVVKSRPADSQRSGAPGAEGTTAVPEAAPGPKAPLAVRILAARGVAPDVAAFVAQRAGDKLANETAEQFRDRVNGLHDELGFLSATEKNPAATEEGVQAYVNAGLFTVDEAAASRQKRYENDAAIADHNSKLMAQKVQVEASAKQPVAAPIETKPPEPIISPTEIKGSDTSAPVEEPPPAPLPTPQGPPPPKKPTTTSAPPADIQRGEVGGKLAAGQIVTTATGRQTTPFPKLGFDTERKTSATVKRVDSWLHANAVAEAEARGDEFNGRQFRAENPTKMPQASKDAMEEYLFGEKQPPVIPSPLKPISPPAAPASSPPVADVTAKPSATRTPEAAGVKTKSKFDLLQSVSNKANRRPYVPLEDAELQQLVSSGDVHGKGPKKGKLTEQGQNALTEFHRQERVAADEEYRAALAEPAVAVETPAKAAAKVQEEVKSVASTQGTRPAKEIKTELVDRLTKAVADAPNESDVIRKTATKPSGKVYETQPDTRTKVTIDIPGDGVFTVWNTKEALQGVVERAKKISTSSTPPKGYRERGISAEDKAWVKEQMAAQPVEAPKLDPIEAALNKAIEATDFKPGQTNEGVTGAPVWLVKDAANGALRVLRAAYKAGKSIAEAISEAIAWMKTKGLSDANEAEAREWLMSKTPEPTTTRILGLDVEAQRRMLSPDDNKAGDRDAERLFDEAGMPWKRRAGLLVPENLDAPQEVAGVKLLAILKRELDPVHQAGLELDDAPPNDRRANFINSVVELARTQGDAAIEGRPTIFSKALIEELGGVAQKPRSEAGKRLFLFKEPAIGEMERIANAPLGALRDIWREQVDPEGMAQKTLQTIKLYLQNFFDAKQVDAVLEQHPDAKAFLDEILADSTISPKPSAKDLVRQIFESPRYKKLGRDKQLAVTLGRQLGLSPEQMARGLEVFDRVFSESIESAEKKALAQAQNTLTPAERAVAGPGTKLWKKIQNFVNAGGLEEYDLLKQWMAGKGRAVPTPEEAAELRGLSEHSQRLLDLTPRQREAAGKDPAKIAAAQDARARAVEDERKAIQKKMVTIWKRWSRPLSWKHWFAGSDVAYNNAQAINETAAGDILTRLTFLTKQSIDVGTANLFYTPQRALAHAFSRYMTDINAGRDADGARANLWKDIAESLGEAYSIRRKTFGARVNALTQGLKGRGLPQNVEGVTGGIHAFDRMQLRVDELLKKKTPEAYVQAFLYSLAGLQSLGFRAAGALDRFQGVPAEFQEMRQQVVTELRRNGKPREVANQQADTVMGDIKAERVTALDEARALLEESGIKVTDGSVSKAAWGIVRGRMYARMKMLELPADAFEARNDTLQQLIGWNLPVEGGPGKYLAGVTKGFQEFFARGGIPTLGIGAFGNAMGTMLNRKLTWLGFGFAPKMFKGDPWFEGDINQIHRKVEAGSGVVMGSVAFALAATGAMIVRAAWPDDPKERERWQREGTKPNTVDFPLGNGRKITVSLTTGPLSVIAPHLLAGGAYHDLLQKRAAKQEKMNAEAAEKGLTPGKIEPINSVDVAGVMAAAAKAALFGGRTAQGAWNTYSDFGSLSIKKAAASTAQAVVPLLPAYAEMTRLAGMSLDPKQASFWDLFVPIPTSGPKRLNMLGDDVSNPDALQRVLGMLTGGTTIRTQGSAESEGQAYASLFASSYRPPALDPNKGYAISGEFRPLTPKEFARYSQERGQNFKRELESLGSLDGMDPKDAKKAVQEAFQRANREALTEIGVTVPEKAQTSSGGRGASGARTSGAARSGANVGGIGLTGGNPTRGTGIGGNRGLSRGRLSRGLRRSVGLGRRGLGRAFAKRQPNLRTRGLRRGGVRRSRGLARF